MVINIFATCGEVVKRNKVKIILKAFKVVEHLIFNIGAPLVNYYYMNRSS